MLLTDEYASADELRMENATVVVPGARTGRRLKELLLAEAESRGMRLLPPRISTLGVLPESLYEALRPVADQTLSRQLWRRALRSVPEERLSRVFPMPPARDDLRGWHRLATTVERLHVQVGAVGKSFHGVIDCCDQGLLFSDVERWTVLAEAQDRYRAELEQMGRSDREFGRMEALAEGRIGLARDLWLAGVSEMPLVVSAMLRASHGGSIRALVHAPSDCADAFDDLGAVIPAAWADREIPLRESDITIRARPGDQAREAVHVMAGIAAGYAADDVVVAVPDEELIPHLEQRFSEAGVDARNAAGKPLESTAPFRLLAAFADYLADSSYRACGALARHPDLWLWLRRSSGGTGGAFRQRDAWLEPLDRYFSGHLPGAFGGRVRMARGKHTAAADALCRALDDERLLGRMTGERTLAGWAPIIIDLLVEVYGTEELNRNRSDERRLIDACSKLRDVAAEFYRLPPGIDETCDAATAIRLMLDEARTLSIPPEPDQAAVELLGWLELHLDDAPVAIVTGFNEPFLPESVNADPFLPNALRSKLGLVDNESRYARDTYQLTTLIHSRERMRVIAGRRTAQGDPLRPSRLMFAVKGPALAERVQCFYGEGADADGPTAAVVSVKPSEFVLPPEPLLSAEEVPDQIYVTAFRKLIEDPYGYALERVLNLDTLDDAAREMDALSFGSLAHAVLERFGRSSEIDSADVTAVRARLDEALDTLTLERFHSAPLPAVRIQIEQLRERLKAFARWQAEWIADGWRVMGVECTTPPEGVPFDVNGRPIHIHGRIDRIDYHAERDTLAVFDYKTGDKAKSPDETHLQGRAGDRSWIDLQLPLYRHLLPAVVGKDGFSPLEPGTGAELRLGYLLLSRDLDEPIHCFADWNEDELDEADETARDVVRLLRQNRFVYNAGAKTKYMDSRMAALLGLGHLASVLDDEDEVEE